MAFLLDGKTIQQGVAFTDADGNQYPANWLNLSSAEEKEAIGLEEVADPEIFDNRFYWDASLPKIKSFYEEMKKYCDLGSLDTHPVRIIENEWYKNI